jgi:tRNA threonylcarbamoyladenosine biosynthesis protein TsaB
MFGLNLKDKQAGRMSGRQHSFVILALESSANRASAALVRTGMPGIQHLHEARHGHAALICELARAALAEAGVEPDEITHVAAGRGPGSFTGLRVALAAAKGFSLATGAYGTGVSCLAAAAHAAAPRAADGHIIATADTRRGSFFAQLFTATADPLSKIIEIDPKDHTPFTGAWHGAMVIGAGAGPLAKAHVDSGLRLDMLAPPIDSLQVAHLAETRISNGLGHEPMLPLYVAPPFLGPSKP